MEQFGQQALVSLFVNIVVLVTVWWALQTFKWDLFVSDPDGPKAKALVILVAIAITHLVSSFLLNYLNWSTMLQHLF